MTTYTDQQVPKCAHLKVIYQRIENPNGTCSDYWVCSDCLHRFVPVARLQHEISTLKTSVKEAWEEGAEAGCNLDVPLHKSWETSNARKIVEGEE